MTERVKSTQGNIFESEDLNKNLHFLIYKLDLPGLATSPQLLELNEPGEVTKRQRFKVQTFPGFLFQYINAPE